MDTPIWKEWPAFFRGLDTVLAHMDRREDRVRRMAARDGADGNDLSEHRGPERLTGTGYRAGQVCKVLLSNVLQSHADTSRHQDP